MSSRTFLSLSDSELDRFLEQVAKQAGVSVEKMTEALVDAGGSVGFPAKVAKSIGVGVDEADAALLRIDFFIGALEAHVPYVRAARLQPGTGARLA